MPFPNERNGTIGAGTPLFEAITELGETISSRLRPDIVATSAHEFHFVAAWSIPLQSGSRLIVNAESSDIGTLHPAVEGSLNLRAVKFWGIELQNAGEWLPYGSNSGISYVLNCESTPKIYPESSMPASDAISQLLEHTRKNGSVELKRFIVESTNPLQNTPLYKMRHCIFRHYRRYGVLSIESTVRAEVPDDQVVGDNLQITHEMALGAYRGKIRELNGLEARIQTVSVYDEGTKPQLMSIKTLDTRGPITIESISPELIRQWGGTALKLTGINTEELYNFGLGLVMMLPIIK